MNIIGHQKIVSFLERAIEKDALGQAYIFSGPEAVGKKTLALELAREISGFSGAINPNLHYLEPEIEEKKGIIKKKDIKIENIRELQRALSMTSGGGYKVAIINDAERLNNTSQNALLKILEEPPEKVLIILVTKDKSRIIPTIISRCSVKEFGLMSDAEIERMIPTENMKKSEIVFWSSGRPGLTKKMLENKEEIERRNEMLSDFRKLFSAGVAEKFIVAEKMSKDGESLLETLELWALILRKKIILNSFELAVDPRRAFVILEKILESRKLVESTNANNRLILENIFLSF